MSTVNKEVTKDKGEAWRGMTLRKLDQCSQLCHPQVHPQILGALKT